MDEKKKEPEFAVSWSMHMYGAMQPAKGNNKKRKSVCPS